MSDDILARLDRIKRAAAVQAVIDAAVAWVETGALAIHLTSLGTTAAADAIDAYEAAETELLAAVERYKETQNG